MRPFRANGTATGAAAAGGAYLALHGLGKKICS